MSTDTEEKTQMLKIWSKQIIFLTKRSSKYKSSKNDELNLMFTYNIDNRPLSLYILKI